MNGFELWWSRLTRVVSFFGGIGIMVFETIFDNQERPWIYAAAIGMMGLPVARVAEGVLGRLSGMGPQVLPQPRPQDQSGYNQSTVIAPPLPGATVGEEESRPGGARN